MTTNSFATEELKRKLEAVTGNESQHCGPMQKLLKRSSSTSSNEQLSDIFQDQFSLSFEDNEDDDEFEMNSEMNDIISEDSPREEQQSDQQQQKEKEQQPTPPQRKKPGRKPNPASPALRKAQNRAAQRAFRERKERHLRELENTIKSLRENQYDLLVKYQRETSHHRSLIEQLEAENYYLKEVAFSFECALNNINGNNDATTKMKNAVSLSVPARSSSSSVLPLNGNGNAVFGSVNSPFGMGIMQMRQANLQSQQSVQTAQQIQNTFLGLLQNQSAVNTRGTNLNIPSPAASNVMMSPNGSGNITTTSTSSASSPPTPDSMVPDSMSPSSTFFAEEFAREITMADMKPFVNSNSAIQISHEQPLFADGYNTSQMMSKSNSNSSNISSGNNNNNNTTTTNNGTNSSYVAEAASMIDNDADLYSTFLFNDDLSSLDDESKQLLSNFELPHTDELLAPEQKRRIHDQMIRLSKKVGQTYPTTIIPKSKYPLSEEQKYYLSLEHDSRIDLIPCLHMRSRMIQYHGQYDLYDLLELLINKAKCHGDPLNPDSWELPEEFFERYEVLVSQHCRIKSDLYKKYGFLPKDFDNFYRKGVHLIS